ncbi:MAG: Uma2 family endonuclease [Anaerolineales bacterium]
MNETVLTPTKRYPPISLDRPGWIPDHIIRDWDPSPYAYQTEEELMPAGGLHGQILAYLMELLRHMLEKRELMFLMDAFLLYRNERGVKRRVAPDLLLMPFRFPPPSAYDLDVEPPPALVVEVTSPNSHFKDLEANVSFYLGLGIGAYLVIDAITPGSQLREPIDVHLWRHVQGGIRKIRPDRDGALTLPEMGVQIFTRKDHIKLVDMATGETLRDMEAERQARWEAERRAWESERRAWESERQAETERQTRQAAEARVRELEAKLRKTGLL